MTHLLIIIIRIWVYEGNCIPPGRVTGAARPPTSVFPLVSNVHNLHSFLGGGSSEVQSDAHYSSKKIISL